MYLAYSVDFWMGTCHNRRGKGEGGWKIGRKKEIEEIERMFISITGGVFSRNVLDKLNGY